ncbi:MAG: hypothetical protein MST03_01985 [Bacteroidales bacterium]|nr:hypothetical protein [Bacteroidales bacterium]
MRRLILCSKKTAVAPVAAANAALMQQPQKQPRYRSYAAAIPLLCSSRTHNQRYHYNATAAMPLLAAYPERKLRRIVCWLLILSAEI